MTAQDDALRSAARYLRPGGALLYATCSFLQCENEERIAAFLSEESDFNEENALSLRPARDGCDGFTAFALRRYA